MARQKNQSENQDQTQEQADAQEDAREAQDAGLAARQETSDAQAEAGADAPDAGPAPRDVTSSGEPVGGNEEPLDTGGDGHGLEPANLTGFGPDSEFTRREDR